MRLFILLILTALSSAPLALAHADALALQYLEDRYTHGLLHQVGSAPETEPVALGRADCVAIKSLNRKQKTQARLIGRAFERSGVHLDLILSSRWCEALETAQLLKLRPVTEEPVLDALTESPEAARDAVLDMLDGVRPGDTALLVTHGANILAVTGIETEPGEIIVVRLRPGADVEIRGRFKAD